MIVQSPVEYRDNGPVFGGVDEDEADTPKYELPFHFSVHPGYLNCCRLVFNFHMAFML